VLCLQTIVIGPTWNFRGMLILRISQFKRNCEIKVTWISKCWKHNTLCYCWHIVPLLRFCYFWHYCTFDKVSLLNSKTCLSNIAKEINFVLLKNAKLKWFKIQNFSKVSKCQKTCAPPNREINVSRKFHEIM